MPELPGKDLARDLIDKSRADSRSTPVEAVIEAVREGGLDDDKAHRLLGRLWTLERMFYYIYGGWGQGLEMNDFPPSIKYLFSKQIVDESTHKMLYLDALLRRGAVATRMEALAAATSDPDLRAVFGSQAVENRSHINMGRRIVEEFIERPVEAQLCR